MLLNNNHVRGIFKYSDDVYFEKDDFVVDGNCIYICTVEQVRGERPSLDTDHLYYSEYPGNKITNASEYYDYLKRSRLGEQVEDKYISAQTLCEILEDTYFGFGDNGIIYDYILYNPNTGIEYSIRGVKEILDYSTPDVLDRIVRENNLNNGLIKVSRNLPEIKDLLADNNEYSPPESNVILLKQYTYLDSSTFIPYRVQELMDPEKNQLYFRFAKGERLEDDSNSFTNAIVSKWKNLYSNNEDAIEKLNSIVDYYEQKIQEEEEKVSRIRGRYCYREVDATETNHLGTDEVYLRPGDSRDIKSIESFSENPCLLNILIKVQSSFGVFRNYSLVIDAKDACDASPTYTETYLIGDDLSLTSKFDSSDSMQRLTLTLNPPGVGVIKSIYYRDSTLDHIHDWVLIESESQDPTCTQSGIGVYECSFPECGYTKEEPIPPLGHITTHENAKEPTCIEFGWWEYWHCSRCDKYLKNSDLYTTQEFSGWNTGNDQVYREPLGSSGHEWSDWVITQPATCTERGIETRTCIRCGATETRPTSGEPHHELTYLRVVPETCGDYGTSAHYHCTRCQKDFLDSSATQEVNSIDLVLYPTGAHSINISDPGREVIVKESTYTDFPQVSNPNPIHGKALDICSSCGNKIERSLPLKKHTMSNGHTKTPVDPFYSGGYHYPASIEGFSVEEQEIRRNYDFRDDVPISQQLANHKIITNRTSDNMVTYTQATCTEYGYWTGTCELCGATNVRQYNWDDPPTGHQINGNNRQDWIPNTCTEDALWEGRCGICNRSDVTMVDNGHLKIGHKDQNSDGYCDVCHSDLEN